MIGGYTVWTRTFDAVVLGYYEAPADLPNGSKSSVRAGVCWLAVDSNAHDEGI